MSYPAGTRTLGVIGHVDHGKTALVRALTGIETDRLAEERERGLSIVLGFAHFEVEGATVDLIDVPGHEAFIRAMVAGATGLDGVVLIIAANEGIQPQTREHFSIARLLDLRCGVVVLTKTDLVERSQLEALIEDVEQLTVGTFLEGAAIVPVSAINGEGLAELKAAIAQLPMHEDVAHDMRPFCLPLDRVFTMRGFGVIGTGTARSGRVSNGDEVEILPRRLRAAVRALQCHGKPVVSARGGQRIAINLRGIDRDQVARGDVVVTAGAMSASSRVDAAIELLPDAISTIKNGMALRLLIGTIDVPIKVRLIDTHELERGATGLAQLRCGREVVCQRGERFILRCDTPSRTLGGGRVIEPHAPRRRRFDESAVDAMRQAGSTSASARVGQLLSDAGVAGVTAADVLAQAGVDRVELAPIAEQLGAVWIGDERLVQGAAAADMLEAIKAALRAYHSAHPMRRGMSLSELVSSLEPSIGTDTLKWALATLRESGEIEGAADRVRITGFDPLSRLSDGERKLATAVAAQFLSGGIEPPSLAEISTRSKPLQAIVNLLLETGELIKLQTTDRKHPMALHADVLQDVKNRLSTRFPYPAQFAVKDVRDLLESTRKFVLPILEHLDASGFTLRRGDLRQVTRQ